MKLSSFLNEDLILIGVGGESKDEAIQRLIDRVVDRFPDSLPREAIVKAVNEREDLGGTTLPSGISIPHARFDRFDDLIIAVAVPSKPYMEKSVEVRMLVLILTASNRPALYLNCLSAFARLSQDRVLFPKLLAARDGREFIDILEDSPYQVRNTVLVENVMNAEVKGVSPDTRLREINDILFQNKWSYLPVVNAKNELIGEIRFFDIMALGIPEYARNMGTLSFTSSLESFENLINREDQIKASDFMKKPVSPLSPKTTLLEAAVTMLHTHERQLAVVDGGKLVGVISYMDILNKIIRN